MSKFFVLLGLVALMGVAHGAVNGGMMGLENYLKDHAISGELPGNFAAAREYLERVKSSDSVTSFIYMTETFLKLEEILTSNNRLCSGEATKVMNYINDWTNAEIFNYPVDKLSRVSSVFFKVVEQRNIRCTDRFINRFREIAKGGDQEQFETVQTIVDNVFKLQHLDTEQLYEAALKVNADYPWASTANLISDLKTVFEGNNKALTLLEGGQTWDRPTTNRNIRTLVQNIDKTLVTPCEGFKDTLSSLFGITSRFDWLPSPGAQVVESAGDYYRAFAAYKMCSYLTRSATNNYIADRVMLALHPELVVRRAKEDEWETFIALPKLAVFLGLQASNYGR